MLVPQYPGLFSSTGMLLADAGRDYTRTVMKRLEGTGPSLSSVAAQLKKQATLDMRAEGFARALLRFTTSLAMRYAGQSHEIEVPVPGLSRQTVIRHFEDAYRAAYGYLRQPSEIEVVNVRVSCRAPAREVPFSPLVRAHRPALPLVSRAIHFGNRRLVSDVFARRDIGAGRSIAGPALIVQEDTTIVLPPGWRAAHDLGGSLELEVSR